VICLVSQDVLFVSQDRRTLVENMVVVRVVVVIVVIVVVVEH